MKKLLLVLCLSGCGGSSIQAGPAYATAVRVAREFCAVVADLPDPAPTSGGETMTTPVIH